MVFLVWFIREWRWKWLALDRVFSGEIGVCAEGGDLVYVAKKGDQAWLARHATHPMSRTE
jgi:hypothetical protein